MKRSDTNMQIHPLLFTIMLTLAILGTLGIGLVAFLFIGALRMDREARKVGPQQEKTLQDIYYQGLQDALLDHLVLH